MREIIKTGTRKARKDHPCEGFEQIDRTISWQELTQFHDEKSPQMPHAVRKGEEYNFQTGSYDGRLYTWKSCKHCHDIVVKYRNCTL